MTSQTFPRTFLFQKTKRTASVHPVAQFCSRTKHQETSHFKLLIPILGLCCCWMIFKIALPFLFSLCCFRCCCWGLSACMFYFPLEVVHWPPIHPFQHTWHHFGEGYSIEKLPLMSQILNTSRPQVHVKGAITTASLRKEPLPTILDRLYCKYLMSRAALYTLFQ